MMRNHLGSVRRGTILAVAGIALAAGVVAAQTPKSEKLMKQISILERVLDGVLVESPYLLVSSRDPAHGIYLEEFGVLFTLEASLIDREDDSNWWDRWKFEKKDGQIIVYESDDDDEDKDEKRETWRERKHRRERELYEGGRAELLEALMDYGETLGALNDNKWVAVAAFLKNSDYFMDNKMSRLVLKARMRDLRSYSQDQISADQLKDRIIIEEY